MGGDSDFAVPVEDRLGDLCSRNRMVLAGSLELPLPRGNWILSPARLPIPPRQLKRLQIQLQRRASIDSAPVTNAVTFARKSRFCPIISRLEAVLRAANRDLEAQLAKHGCLGCQRQIGSRGIRRISYLNMV